MANFKRTVATAEAKVAKAENEAFAARPEAIDAILRDAAPHGVLMLCARALTELVPNCCEAHQDEFKAEFLRVPSGCDARAGRGRGWRGRRAPAGALRMVMR